MEQRHGSDAAAVLSKAAAAVLKLAKSGSEPFIVHCCPLLWPSSHSQSRELLWVYSSSSANWELSNTNSFRVPTNIYNSCALP